MAIGASLKKGFSATVKSAALVALFFVYGVVVNLINVKVTNRLQTAGSSRRAALISAAVSLAIALVGVFLQAGVLGYLRDLIKQGTSSIASFFSSGAKYYLRILMFGIVVAVVVFAVILAGTLTLNALGEKGRLVGVILAVILSLIAFYFIILIFLAPYLIVAEDKGAFQAMGESIGLVKQHILEVLGMGLLIVIMGFLAGILFGMIVGGANLVMHQQPGATQNTIAVLSSFVNAVLGVYMAAAFMHYTLGLRQSANTNIQG